ncbi:MAG: carboxypeptidase regulatory-like domain-containing protein [Gemmatimonadales bacterium]
MRGKVAVLDIADPIPSAVVFLLGVNDEVFGATVTDSAGRFELRVSEPGTFVLRVHRVGYVPASSEALSLPEGRILDVRVNMRPDATMLEGVTVYGIRLTPGQAEFERRKEENLSVTTYMIGRKSGNCIWGRSTTSFNTVFPSEDAVCRSFSTVGRPTPSRWSTPWTGYTG